MTYDVAIIGGGASGIALAIMLKKYDLHVAVIESNDRILKKVLATGNGKCNFSNVNVDVSRYNTDFVKNALDEFGYKDAIDFFKSIGMLSIVEDDRLYPYSRQASTVVGTMLRAVNCDNIFIRTSERVESIRKNGDIFSIDTSSLKYNARYVVLASGSNATTGILSHELLKSFGHNLRICMPSLTYLTCDKDVIAGLNGIRVKASATIKVAGKKMTRFGELLFKNNAISGIMVFELSSFFARKVTDSDIVSIDLAPDMSKDELVSFVKGAKGSTLDRLMGFMPKQLAILIAKRAGNDLDKAINLVKKYDIKVTGLGDIKNAQVVSGGLAVDGFDSSTLESKKVDNLYAIGEVLDVDGECGGYNLHWAWASANLVAKNIGEKYDKNR